MKLKVHPLFFVAVLLYALLGGVKGYLLAFFAVSVHEVAHCVVAYIGGAKQMTVVLMPYGAALTMKGEIKAAGALLIAGPLANLTLACFTLSLCWLIPELYGFLKTFIQINVILAFVNLLPAYPLDGGRLFRLLFPYRWAKAASCVLTLITGAASVVFFIITKQLSLLFLAAFLLLSFFATIVSVSNKVQEAAPLYSLAKTDEEGHIRRALIKRGKRKVRRLSSAEVTSLLLKNPPGISVAEALKNLGYK